MAKGTCSIDGCQKPARTRGWCNMHYRRWLLYGTPDAVLRIMNTSARFWFYVEKRGEDECWPWTGPTRNGYGRIFADGRRHEAHRWAYEMLVGPIPDGCVIDHQCHTPECVGGAECAHRRCCNPAHMLPVRAEENSSRGRRVNFQGRRTHCPQSHEYTPENTAYSKRGARICRACKREQSTRSRRAKRKALSSPG